MLSADSLFCNKSLNSTIYKLKNSKLKYFCTVLQIRQILLMGVLTHVTLS